LVVAVVLVIHLLLVQADLEVDLEDMKIVHWVLEPRGKAIQAVVVEVFLIIGMVQVEAELVVLVEMVFTELQVTADLEYLVL